LPDNVELKFEDTDQAEGLESGGPHPDVQNEQEHCFTKQQCGQEPGSPSGSTARLPNEHARRAPRTARLAPLDIYVAAAGRTEDSNFAIPRAARTGKSIKELRTMLLGGASINSRDQYSWTALHYAVLYQRLPLVLFLLSEGASPDGVDPITNATSVCPTPLAVALKSYGSGEVVRELLAAGAGMAMTNLAKPLCSVPENEHDDDGLERACCFRDAIQYAVVKNLQAMLRILLRNGRYRRKYDSHCPLLLAVSKANVTIVSILLEHGFDMHHTSRSALGQVDAFQAAAHLGHDKIVSMLIAAGAKVNARPLNERGGTALQYAVLEQHTSTATCLLRGGADVRAQSVLWSGYTLLQTAILQENAALVDVLLQFGADPNEMAKNRAEYSALSAAISVGSSKLFDRLIEAGALVNQDWSKKPTPSSVSNLHVLIAIRQRDTSRFVAKLIFNGLDLDACLPTRQTLGDLAMIEACRRPSLLSIETILEHCSILSADVLLRVCDVAWTSKAGLSLFHKLNARWADLGGQEAQGELFRRVPIQRRLRS
jgi:ankyrin repeat protein